jgi:hypothetical protein
MIYIYTRFTHQIYMHNTSNNLAGISSPWYPQGISKRNEMKTLKRRDKASPKTKHPPDM